MERNLPHNTEDIDIPTFETKYKEVLESFKSGDEAVILDAIARLLSSLPRKIKEEVDSNIKAKDSLERFKKYTELLNTCISETTFINEVATGVESTNQAYKLFLHSLDIWHDSIIMFNNKRYPSATFLAIVCMEESAKVLVCCFKILRILSQRGSNVEVAGKKSMKKSKRQRDPLMSHKLKHLLAGMSGLLVNSRADRLFGLPRVVEFLEMIEQNRLEIFRQSCLYADTQDYRIVLPKDLHRFETAAFYISLAGEVIVENLFFIEPGSSFIKELDDFESNYLAKIR